MKTNKSLTFQNSLARAMYRDAPRKCGCPWKLFISIHHHVRLFDDSVAMVGNLIRILLNSQNNDASKGNEASVIKCTSNSRLSHWSIWTALIF